MDQELAHSGVARDWEYRTRVLLAVALGVAFICSVCAIGPAYLLWHLPRTPFPFVAGPFLAFGVVGAYVLAAVGLTSARQFIRYRNLPRLMVEHDGALCPTCIKPLRFVDEVGDDALMRCDACRAEFNRLGLRAYWGGWPQSAWIWRRWYISLATPRSTWHALSLRLRRWLYVQPARLSFAVSSLSAVPLLAFLVLLNLPLYSDAVYLLFKLAPVVIIGAGCAGYAMSIEFVEDRKARCNECEYEKHDDEHVSPRCPECGCAWNEIGGTKYASHRYLPGRLTFSVVLAVAGIMLLAASMTQSLPQRYAATESIMAIALRHPDKAFEEWRELRNNRELTDEQRNRLIEGVLEAREAGRRPSGFAAAWMSDQIQAGHLTEEQRERYLQSTLFVTLAGPATLRVGEQAQIDVFADYRGGIGFGVTHVYFGGFRTIDAAEPIDRAEESVFAANFGALLDEGHMYAPYRTPFEPSLTITGDTPGETIIAADVWIVVHPPRTQTGSITWNDDGSPNLDDDVIWVEHRQLEHVLSIVDD